MSALLPRGRVCYTVGTIAHNGSLFWLDVVERSLVKHISSPIMSYPAISIAFYQLSLLRCPLCSLFAQPLLPLSFAFSSIYPSCWECFHLSSRLEVWKKTWVSFHKYFGTERVMIRPSVLFLPVPFQSAELYQNNWAIFAHCFFSGCRVDRDRGLDFVQREY